MPYNAYIFQEINCKKLGELGALPQIPALLLTLKPAVLTSV